ncbi:hypothetical protein DNTS_011908 [Danionella cerebrum]|uniref:Calcitonin peptide-like domain-containing protein n=1 Tax=Danionella cerebrum TaxID=2873325 RepID=A0A553Q7I0_9TELE|nr:hypothetical protein DNTS_011908 [Danionella translucida]
MLVLKICSFLMVYSAVLGQVHISSADTHRHPGDSLVDSLTPVDVDLRTILVAFLKNLMMKSTGDLSLDPELPNHPHSGHLVKRCAGLSTCVLGKLSQELLRLHSIKSTDVGAETPGRKRRRRRSAELDQTRPDQNQSLSLKRADPSLIRKDSIGIEQNQD